MQHLWAPCREAEWIKVYCCIAEKATKGRNAGSHTQVDARNAEIIKTHAKLMFLCLTYSNALMAPERPNASVKSSVPCSYQEAAWIKIYFCIADRATKGRNAGSHTQVDARNANIMKPNVTSYGLLEQTRRRHNSLLVGLISLIYELAIFSYRLSIDLCRELPCYISLNSFSASQKEKCSVMVLYDKFKSSLF